MKILLPLLFLIASFGALAQAQEESIETAENNEIAVVQFEETSYDFGEIEEGNIVTHVFKFTNTGNEPLVISRATGSCGCTVPYYPRVPIMPGKSSEIEVNFDSKHRMGIQHKRVTLHANTEPSVIVLNLKGEVVPATEQPEASKGINKKKQVEEMKAKNEDCIAIFPNPTSDILQLDLKKYIGMNAKIAVRNDAGQNVLQKEIKNIGHEASQLDVSNFKNGMYFITINFENQAPITQCFVVVHD